MRDYPPQKKKICGLGLEDGLRPWQGDQQEGQAQAGQRLRPGLRRCRVSLLSPNHVLLLPERQFTLQSPCAF